MEFYRNFSHSPAQSGLWSENTDCWQPIFPGLSVSDTTPKRNAMKKVISVRFKDNGKTYYFDPATGVKR